VKVSRHHLDTIDFEELEIRDYTADLDLSSSVAEVIVPPGAVHRRAYSRRSDKYYIVIRGALDFILDGEPIELGVGDLCVVPQGTRFSYRNSTDEPAVTALIHTPSFDLNQEVFEEL